MEMKEIIEELKKWRDNHKNPIENIEYHEIKYKTYDKVIKFLVESSKK